MMNLNNQPTVDELARLFAARKDTLDSHILWVCASGEVRLDSLETMTDEAQFEERNPNMRARLKMYRRGQGYVGKKAAADKQYVGRVLQTLQSEWAALQHTPGVAVIDRLC
ncbi:MULTISPECIES: hypothetical protein [Pseudomonas]|uniref:Uncharacterized protein n=2 Tax=Pseudomonas TaxID=286 RepID=A0A411MKK3_9PSED|nr:MULTISPECIES: hypothetical protein [Pseudomonas]MDD1016569.1 hypothetical protein [Pseudomonas rubra]MDD1038562.1 hypothetical protein [Pseudomonas rubra]MDD1154746.1 hypothetical protein [Pseudomonas rubra]QBF27322.1 hypothetical protein EXN22_17120 [Pseudomonas tructae]